MSKTELQKLQESGDAPSFLTNEGYKHLTNGYLLEGETPLEMYKRAARHSAKNYSNKEAYYNDFLEAITKNWLCCATPILSNAETDKLQISCYSGMPTNKVSSIMDHMKELAMLTKNGGGVGSSFDSLIPVSGDIVPFLKILESTIEGITQGTQRRGSVASYLNIKHPNIDDFLEIRNPIGDISRRCLSVAFHNAVTIDDEVMNAIVSGDKHYRSLWNRINTQRVETGEPYIMFQGNANRNCPEEYVGRITQSNLCLHGDTMIKTKEGSVAIKDLVGKTVEIHDGVNWVTNSAFRLTQEEAKFYKITFETTDGETVSVLATENHNWPTLRAGLCPTINLKYQDYVLSHNGTFAIVIGLEEVEEKGPAYCTTVDTTHLFQLESGIITGNCSEIMAPVTKDETFVCCLSSLNLAKWDEWKDYTFPNTGLTLVELSIYFLDSVITNFINQAKNMVGLENAVRFAERHRMLGLGVLGWHTLLQSKMYAFDSFDAMRLNAAIFNKMKIESYKASDELAIAFGPCEVNGKRRNTALLAIAPTMSNSIISGGVSQGIEPITSNFFAQKSSKGVFIKSNPVLKKYLESIGMDNYDTWDRIDADRGSVKNIPLDEEVKRVFLTAREISQFALVKQAGQRQKYIDQAQSLNLFFNVPGSKEEGKKVAKYINEVQIMAWQEGVKSLYYLKTDSPLKGDSIAIDKSDCKACEG